MISVQPVTNERIFTMTRQTITKLNVSTQDPSKQEEIEYIQEIASSIPDGAYLKGLFTDEFIGWVERKIKDDWTLDILNDLEHYITQASKAEQAFRECQENAKRDFKCYEDHIEQLKQEIATIHKNKDRRFNQVNEQYSNTWNKLHELRNEYARTCNYLEDASAKIQEQSLEILKLKAQMFDMSQERES
jgi:hypothetical protein